MHNQIIKSEEFLRKEEQLKALEAEYLTLKDELLESRELLEDEKIGIEQFQKAFGVVVLEKAERVLASKMEIEELFLQVEKSHRISREDRKAIEKIYQNLKNDNVFEDDSLDFESEEFRQQVEEEFKKEKEQFVQENTKKQSNESQKDVRKVYIRLASQFHPDKAKSPEEAKLFHDLMQEINQAYQQGDIAQLLEIEALYSSNDSLEEKSRKTGKSLLSLVEEKLVSFFKKKELLEAQLRKVKKQLSLLKNSEQGIMYREYQKVSQLTDQPMEYLTSEYDERLETMEEIKYTLEHLLETGQYPDSSKEYQLIDLGQHEQMEEEPEDLTELEMHELMNFLDKIFDGRKGK